MFTVAFDTVNTVISYLEIVPRGSDEDGGRPRVWRRHRGQSVRFGLFDMILHKRLW